MMRENLQEQSNPINKAPEGFIQGVVQCFSSCRRDLRGSRPLIHCITNPISINDCANAVLAVGGRPIMAEHPGEAEEITAVSQALALNLGNITDARMRSMKLSGKTAQRLSIPCVLDAVGAACSGLRLQYARECLQAFHPSIVKGNCSELKALCGEESHSIGVDAGAADAVTPETRGDYVSLFSHFSEEFGCVVFCTGKEDLIVDGMGKKAVSIENGCENLSWITGTGCMVNALTAAYCAEAPPFEACVLAAAVMGIAGEQAAEKAGEKGPGSFRAALLDALFSLKEEELASKLRCRLY